MRIPSSTPEITTDGSAEGIAAARLRVAMMRLTAAAAAAGRDPAGITLVAVSKTQTAEAIATLARLGQRDFGENYLQEALPKISALRDRKLTWHFIGQLQSNKTRAVAESFDWVHTVDRVKLAERLAAQRPSDAAPLQVCVQVRLDDEPGKGGVSAAELPPVLAAVAASPRLQLRGLMAIPPAEPTPTAQRHWFAQLARLLAASRTAHPSMDTLSMGMSGDLESAVAEGSTLVRLGTALFGERLQSGP
jgi:pyridoxal phosphate enzyme (YggS family)